MRIKKGRSLVKDEEERNILGPEKSLREKKVLTELLSVFMMSMIY
jgi:hypothetical protein